MTRNLSGRTGEDSRFGAARPSTLGRFGSRVALVVALAGLSLAPALAASGQAAQQPAPQAAGQALSAEAWANQVWASTHAGDEAKFEALLASAPRGDTPELVRVRAVVDRLRAHIAEREELRLKHIAETRTELDKDFTAEATDIAMSNALRHALELWLLSPEKDRAALLAEPRIVELVKKAEAAARAAEARGDWLIASELFFRLDTLLDVQGTYRADVNRTNQRLGMLRLYVPKRLWELRNQRQLAEKTDAKELPPYNPFGDDFGAKIAQIDQDMVTRSLLRAAQEHVENTPLQKMVLGGLESVRTFVSTRDLAEAFPGLKDDAARAKVNAFLDSEVNAFRAGPANPDIGAVDSLLRRLTMFTRLAVDVPDKAVLHEFGNGAMSQLDEFSAIIWPDEKARFDKLTSGKFVGVGISIEYDEFQAVRVVTPLEGTPAQRAGLRAGDIIKKVDGRDIYGFTLDQAVDVITGPPKTPVVLTMERTLTQPDGKEDKVQIDFTIVRDIIETKSIRGWKRTGTHEDDWDWFLDKDAGIGYIRMSQFADSTTDEFDRAVKQMKAQGLRGLILDLRFNPGGLLNQAVDISNRFIDGGPVVKTKAPGEGYERVERATPGRATLRGLPVIVLVNESSASASEIVSGAIQAYARQNQVNAIIMGQRSFGKGSVQNVYAMQRGVSAMKLTTQYYYLPDDRLIHRKPGASIWGIEPDFKVEMLPKQQTDTIVLRRNADVVPLDEHGKPIEQAADKVPNVDDLVNKSMDLQLQTAIAVLEAQTLKPVANQAMKPADADRKTP
jgi:carboxyl-terminal processing protease